jgi:hypothetical protein
MMISRWQRRGPVSGLLLCVTWAPMAIAISRLPDLGSAQGVEAFWRANRELMQGVILSVSVGFLFLLVFLGALIELLRSLRGAGAMVWTASGSALMFMTALNVALGLAIAGGLLVDRDPASTYALDTAGFMLAAPAAFAGATFFVAVTVITWETRALPRWSGWLAILGVLANWGCSRHTVPDGSAQLRQRDCGWYRRTFRAVLGVDLCHQRVVAAWEQPQQPVRHRTRASRIVW